MIDCAIFYKNERHCRGGCGRSPSQLTWEEKEKISKGSITRKEGREAQGITGSRGAGASGCGVIEGRVDLPRRRRRTGAICSMNGRMGWMTLKK